MYYYNNNNILIAIFCMLLIKFRCLTEVQLVRLQYYNNNDKNNGLGKHIVL